MRKSHFNEQESVGLTPEEKDKAEKYMRAHFTSSQCDIEDQPFMYEMFMIGYTFHDIQREYPKYDIRQIIMTAALHKWGYQRETVRSSIQSRIQQKIGKAVMEQVDFLTTLFDVAAIDNLQEMKNYVKDPDNAPKPKMSISSLKEYKEAVDMLAKVLNSINSASSPMPVEKKDKEAALNITSSPNRIQGKKKSQPNEDDDVIDIKDLA